MATVSSMKRGSRPEALIKMARLSPLIRPARFYVASRAERKACAFRGEPFGMLEWPIPRDQSSERETIDAMSLTEIERLLRAHRSGEVETNEAARRISDLHYEDIGYARVDHDRLWRSLCLHNEDRLSAVQPHSSPLRRFCERAAAALSPSNSLRQSFLSLNSDPSGWAILAFQRARLEMHTPCARPETPRRIAQAGSADSSEPSLSVPLALNLFSWN